MLSDRSYMRTDYPRRGTSVLVWFLCALAAMFLLDMVLTRWLHTNVLETGLALTPGGLRHGRFWTLLTYILLHADILHLLLNGLGLYLVGRELLGPLGPVRFAAVSVVSAVCGSLLWFACHFNQGGLVLLGASGVVMSLFVVFACVFPDRAVFFFPLPVALRPRLLAWILVGFDGLGFLFGELPGGRFDTGIAHSAHLGGMLAGWLFYRFVYANNGLDRAPSFELPGWLRRRSRAKDASAPVYKVDIQRQANLRHEVDRILDKINSEGFGALTDHEKRVLDEAKDLLSKH